MKQHIILMTLEKELFISNQEKRRLLYKLVNLTRQKCENTFIIFKPMYQFRKTKLQILLIKVQN